MNEKILDITENMRFTQLKGFDTVDLDGEKALIDINAGKYIMFNETCTRIWDLLEKPRCIKEILDLLYEEYKVPSMSQYREEIISCIQHLFKYHLIKQI